MCLQPKVLAGSLSSGTVLPPSCNFASFCATGLDNIIRFYDSRDNSTKLFEGHTEYINSCDFFPLVSSLRLATVSGIRGIILFFYLVDDMTCKIWDIGQGTEEMVIPLQSAGTSVRTHKENPDWVCHQRKGLIV